MYEYMGILCTPQTSTRNDMTTSYRYNYRVTVPPSLPSAAAASHYDKLSWGIFYLSLEHDGLVGEVGTDAMSDPDIA